MCIFLVPALASLVSVCAFTPNAYILRYLSKFASSRMHRVKFLLVAEVIGQSLQHMVLLCFICLPAKRLNTVSAYCRLSDDY